jgi:hypothetical protein
MVDLKLPNNTVVGVPVKRRHLPLPVGYRARIYFRPRKPATVTVRHGHSLFRALLVDDGDQYSLIRFAVPVH